MREPAFSWSLFAQAPIIGIVRNLSLADVKAILPLYREAGLTTIEITMNTPDAEAIIWYAVEHYSERLNIGAGTVCTVADLDRALAAGAQFIVTPIIDESVIRVCVQNNVPIFPGAFTPSEIHRAWSLGASMVKVFPCTSLGPAYISDLKAPLGPMKLLPTGGVTLDNMAEFFKAGAAGAGIGGHLFDKTLIYQKNWPGLLAHFRAFMSQIPVATRTP